MSGRVNHPGQFPARTTSLLWSVFNERQQSGGISRLRLCPQGSGKGLPRRTPVALDTNGGTFFHGAQHDASQTKQIQLGHQSRISGVRGGYLQVTRRVVEGFSGQRTYLGIVIPIDAERDALAFDLLFNFSDFLTVVLKSGHGRSFG